MAETLRLEIVTPQAVVFSEDVDMVTFPGSEGQMGVYPQHVPLITMIIPGEIIVNRNGVETFLAVGEGARGGHCEKSRNRDRHGDSLGAD